MANYENIKDANSKRTPSERRELARIAGKASGKARRRKANMRETANRLLTMVGEVEGLSDILRANGGESTYEEIITMAMIQKAALGDVRAYEALKSTVGQTGKSDIDLEEQQADIELKQAKKQSVTIENEKALARENGDDDVAGTLADVIVEAYRKRMEDGNA